MVYACARVISWNLCRLPRVFEDKNNKKVEMNDLDDLFGRPNPFMTRRTFWEAVILNLLLPCREGFGRGQRGGQCFIVCDSGKEDYHVDLAKGEIPVAMYPYNDQYVSPEYDNSKHFIGWKFEIREQEILQHYAPHEIIRIYNASEANTAIRIADFTLPDSKVINAPEYTEHNQNTPMPIIPATKLLVAVVARTLFPWPLRNIS